MSCGLAPCKKITLGQVLEYPVHARLVQGLLTYRSRKEMVMFQTAPRLAQALALVALIVTGGCSSWHTCIDSPYVLTDIWWGGITDHPIAAAASLGVVPVALGVCVAVVHTKTAIGRPARPAEPWPSMPDVEEWCQQPEAAGDQRCLHHEDTP